MLLVISLVSELLFGFCCVIFDAFDDTTLNFIGLVHLHPSKYSILVECLSISFRKCIKNFLLSQRKLNQIYYFGQNFFIFLIFSPFPTPEYAK